MASSNRHWPSLFKSKPCNTHHQWQHDINTSSLLSQKSSPYAPGCEERSPEPKPRWNPKPEQIRILESIFNSGMVNPPRDEIRKIRAQLQEYGQVGDANVFYWFQNRKSRSKHKLRHLQSSAVRQSSAARQHPGSNLSSAATPSSGVTAAATSSSSSCSDRSTGSDKPRPPPPSVAAINATVEASVSPAATLNQTFSLSTEQLCAEHNLPFLQAPLQSYCYTPASIDLAGIIPPGPDAGLLWTELVMGQDGCKPASPSLHTNYGVPPTNTPSKTCDNNPNTVTVAVTGIAAATGSATTATTPAGIASSLVNESQGTMEIGVAFAPTATATRSIIVFINEVAFEVTAAPINIREAFGIDAVLFNSSGQPVPTDEWGVTIQPLQHGSTYYLV